MKNLYFMMVGGLLASSTWAVPQVAITNTKQDASSREVTVEYTLENDPAIITVNVQTNAGENTWVDIDPALLQFFAGDVHKCVEPGTRTIKWRPDKAWPGENITDDNLRIGITAWATNAPPNYMVIDLVAANGVRYFACEGAVPGGVTNDCYKSYSLLMRRVPAANVTWRMGSPTTEKGRKTDGREDAHLVTLTHDYYLGVYPVTQKQYEVLVDKNKPSFFSGSYPYGPVESVSFETIRGKADDGYDWPINGHAVSAYGFLGRLRSLVGWGEFDLPTEAQWEYACRAGSGEGYYNELAVLNDNGWDANLNVIACYIMNSTYKTASGTGTMAVGSFLPNSWGFYDMLGNVFEFTLNYYKVDITNDDPEVGPETGSARVTRGGCSGNYPVWCRCAARDSAKPDANDNGIGFRVCLVLP